jgi:hypothetical protein
VILGTFPADIITVCTERKIKRKKRKGDGSGPSSAGVATIVFEPEEKIYRVCFTSAGVSTTLIRCPSGI